MSDLAAALLTATSAHAYDFKLFANCLEDAVYVSQDITKEATLVSNPALAAEMSERANKLARSMAEHEDRFGSEATLDMIGAVAGDDLMLNVMMNNCLIGYMITKYSN